MKLSNYSLNYRTFFKQNLMDLFGFLVLCRELNLEGASLHIEDLAETGADFLRTLRRTFLDQGLSISMLTVTTDFGIPESEHPKELEKARAAIRVATFLGAPILRVFAGSPHVESERQNSFKIAVDSIRKVCEEGARVGLPIGLQNHNHGALVRTGKDVISFIEAVDHSNLTFILDTGQFAGSSGASGEPPVELREADYLASIRDTASLARHVRMKFYHPRPDGSEPWIDYDKVFDILQSVHYQGFLDIVYEPVQRKEDAGEGPQTAIPRVLSFLRSKIPPSRGVPASKPTHSAARYVSLASGKYFIETQVRSETAVAFLEGPAADRAGNVYFSDITAERILKWDSKLNQLTVFREKSNQANGLRFDRQGRLLACEGGGRVTRTDMKSGEITVLADHYQGHSLGEPNDLAIDGQGRIYFTSRLSNRDPKTGNVNSVYRIDAPGQIARILNWPKIDMPNGVVTSPDDRILYLIDADGREGGARCIRAYELKSDGTPGKEWLLYNFYPGRSGDGMCIDAKGNLYVAAGLHRRRGTSETLDTQPGIHVITPEGKLVAFVETPEDSITNCTFGGSDLRTLYITCGKLLLSLRTRIPGKDAYRPEA